MIGNKKLFEPNNARLPVIYISEFQLKNMFKIDFGESPSVAFRYKPCERLPVTVKSMEGVTYIGYLSADKRYVEGFENNLPIRRIREGDRIQKGISREYLRRLNSSF